MHPQEAAQAFSELGEIREQTRQSLRDFWFPLALFGALMLGSVPLIAAFGSSALGPYWFLAGPSGGFLVSRYYAHRAREVGVEGPYVPYAAIGIGIFVGSILMGALGGALGAELVAVAGPPLVISAGLLAYGWLDRSVGEAAVAAVLAVFTLFLVRSDMDPERVTIFVTFTYGAVWLAAGLLYRRLQH